jgi:adenylate cyclase
MAMMLKGGDIFGDGVNIAARIEGLAEPGGICNLARSSRPRQAQAQSCMEAGSAAQPATAYSPSSAAFLPP